MFLQYKTYKTIATCKLIWSVLGRYLVGSWSVLGRSIVPNNYCRNSGYVRGKYISWLYRKLNCFSQCRCKAVVLYKKWNGTALQSLPLLLPVHYCLALEIPLQSLQSVIHSFRLNLPRTFLHEKNARYSIGAYCCCNCNAYQFYG